ncbi:MAG: hypothetical protein NTW41_04170 [Verrucomicrobia bacterium]|nr:hypothetical protein [Verrucomicrobiota bacterium]
MDFRYIKRFLKNSQATSGSALILVLLITSLLATIAVSFLSTSRVEQIAAKNFSRQNAASGLAEMATQQAMGKVQQGFTVNGTGTTVITTQPGAITQFVFTNGNITSPAPVITGNATTYPPTATLFSGSGNVTTNGTANLNNLQNPSSNSSATTNQFTITGNRTELILVPMENITSNGTVIGRVAYYVDDEGTKLNANSATGNRTALNAGNRPQDIAALVSSAASSFSNIINSSSSNTSSITGWSHFFRPEQVGAAVSGISGNHTPFISTATPSASTTANMSHLLTPWGTQRLYINALSTNAIDGTGDASVNTIHAALTNSTLTAIFGSDFAAKYTSTGVKQIAANMLQMRDPNTATVNASFSYQGPLIGSRTLNASTYIPQEYLGFAPYPIVSEVSIDVTYGNGPPYLRPFLRVNVELYNPYPIAFNAPNATLEYFIRGLTWNMTHTINSTGQTYGPYRYGGYGNWTDTTTSPEYGLRSDLRDPKKPNTQFSETGSIHHNPYGTMGIIIPAYSKVKYNMAGPAWGTYGQALTTSVFPFDQNDIVINSITDVRCTITYIKITANSTIVGGLFGASNINPNTIRDWVSGADVGPFIPNNGSLSMVGGFNYVNSQNISFPVNTPITFPRGANWFDCIFNADNISKYSYQRLCPLIKTSMAASSNLTASTRSWTINASTANQTFNNVTSASGITTANQTEQFNDANANPSYDSGNTIPSDPSFNNYNGNAIYADATLSNGTLTNTTDMRIPELPSFSGNYFYTSPSDLGLVPTNQRWRRLRMQMQPSSEGSMIPDWAMLDVISFGNSTDPNSALNRMTPVNINGRFYLPGNITNSSPPAPRTIGISALAQVLSLSGNSSIQNPVAPTSSAYSLTSNETLRFKGNSTSSANITALANNIGNMTWSANSTWGKGNSTNDPSSRRKTNKFPVNQYILPSEIMEISGVADAVTPNYTSTSTHFKTNEGRASALIPAVTTRSSCFMIYAYAQALDNQGNIDSEALTKTLVEVQYDSSTTPPSYKVKKLYTQPIPLGP